MIDGNSEHVAHVKDMKAEVAMEAMARDTDPTKVAMEDIKSQCNYGCEYRFYVVLLNKN